MSIPNNNPFGVTTTITVPEVGIIRDLDVALYITHQEQGDLLVTLEHDGTMVTLINRAGSNAGGCGPSIYGYPADNYGMSATDPLVLDDSAEVGIDCYDGSVGQMATGVFRYTGPASPSQPLGAFNGMDQSGEWTITVSDHLFYNSGSLAFWGLRLTSGPCAPELSEVCDGDGDGILTGRDLAASGCLAGPIGYADPTCLCMDTDGDGDVDLSDFATLQKMLPE